MELFVAAPPPPHTVMIRVRAASWDTQPRLPYNPNAPRKPPKVLHLTAEAPLSHSSTAPPRRTDPPVSEILNRHQQEPSIKAQAQYESYMGYERWLPSPPKVEKPRFSFNAASLAYIGDCIYEEKQIRNEIVCVHKQCEPLNIGLTLLYARRHFLFPPLSIEDYNDRVMSVVRCEAQDELLKALLADNYFSAEERDILRWGKNVTTTKSRTKRRAGMAVYNRASSLETLIGYLYLTNPKRLEDIMSKLGFSTGASMDSVLKDSNGMVAKRS